MFLFLPLSSELNILEHNLQTALNVSERGSGLHQRQCNSVGIAIHIAGQALVNEVLGNVGNTSLGINFDFSLHNTS